MKALDLGEVFEANFGGTTLPGRTTRTIVLSVPEGQSTGGGTQASQSISLVPDDRSVGILVSGTVNPATMTAELRGFPYLDDTHRLRFGGKRLDIPEAAYREFLEKVKAFLESNQYAVTVVNQMPASARQRYQKSAKAAPGGGQSALWIVFILLLLAGAGAAVFFLLRQ